MTNLKTLIVVICLLGVLPAFAADNKLPLVNPSDTKDHIGQTATVCGKVASSHVGLNGVAGRGFPVNFYLDQPEATPVFYFIAFPGEQASRATADPQKLAARYQDKQVCVSGKIIKLQNGPTPLIMVTDQSKIKTEAAAK